MKRQDRSIAVSPFYQLLFVIGVLGGWAVGAALLAHQLASNYTNTGTWVFMSSTWLFPILIFVTSLGFASRRYASWLQRLFFGVMLATAAVSVYGVINWVDSDWYNTVYTRHHPLSSNASYWQTFGNTWIVMAASLVAYIGFLLWVKGKGA